MGTLNHMWETPIGSPKVLSGGGLGDGGSGVNCTHLVNPLLVLSTQDSLYLISQSVHILGESGDI